MTAIKYFGKSRSVLVAVALMSSVVVAFAQEASVRTDGAAVTQRTNLFTRVCAMRDLQLVTLMEELSDTKKVSAEKLFEAFLTQMRARTTCIEGRESAALSIYDTITLGLAPTVTQR
jgi:hypothetical protein